MGLVWGAVDLDVGTIEVRAAAVRVRGQGLVVKSTKTDAGRRTLVLPRWCTQMLLERAQRLAAIVADSRARPVFPAPLGGWRDPSNTQADLRDAFAAAGFDWVTTDVYFGRKVAATSAAAVLEALGDASPAV